jgi:hypothetical protein
MCRNRLEYNVNTMDVAGANTMYVFVVNTLCSSLAIINSAFLKTKQGF